MALRKRIVARASARRPPTEPLVPLTATSRISRVVGAFLLFVLLMHPGRSANDPAAAPDDRDPAALLERLGLERQAKPVPDLARYLAAKGAPSSM